MGSSGINAVHGGCNGYDDGQWRYYKREYKPMYFAQSPAYVPGDNLRNTKLCRWFIRKTKSPQPPGAMNPGAMNQARALFIQRLKIEGSESSWHRIAPLIRQLDPSYLQGI